MTKSRPRSIEIYLKEGLEDDDQIFEIWNLLRRKGRPQDSFRRALKLGLHAMLESGELPRSIRQVADPEILGPSTNNEYTKKIKSTSKKKPVRPLAPKEIGVMEIHTPQSPPDSFTNIPLITSNSEEKPAPKKLGRLMG